MGLNRSVVGLSGFVRITGVDRKAFEGQRRTVRVYPRNAKNDEYRKQAQITELNALNAAMAVIRFKQHFKLLDRLDDATWYIFDSAMLEMILEGRTEMRFSYLAVERIPKQLSRCSYTTAKNSSWAPCCVRADVVIALCCWCQTAIKYHQKAEWPRSGHRSQSAMRLANHIILSPLAGSSGCPHSQTRWPRQLCAVRLPGTRFLTQAAVVG